MEIIAKIFYSILLTSIGYLMLKYRRVVKSWTGNFVWAEQYLWNGWTYIVIILLWLFCMLIWVLYPFWWLELLFWPSNWNNIPK